MPIRFCIRRHVRAQRCSQHRRARSNARPGPADGSCPATPLVVDLERRARNRVVLLLGDGRPGAAVEVGGQLVLKEPVLVAGVAVEAPARALVDRPAALGAEVLLVGVGPRVPVVAAVVGLPVAEPPWTTLNSSSLTARCCSSSCRPCFVPSRFGGTPQHGTLPL